MDAKRLRHFISQVQVFDVSDVSLTHLSVVFLQIPLSQHLIIAY